MTLAPEQVMSLITILYLTLYIAVGFLFSLELLYIAQLKEYKAYRLLNFITSKKGQKQLLAHPFFIISIVAAVLQMATKSNIFIFYLLVLLCFWIYRVIVRKIYRPKFTIKANVLLIIAGMGELLNSMFIVTILLVIPPGFWSLGIVILLYAIFRPIWLLFWTQLFQIPTYFAKRYYIAKATKKISTYTNLRVIGITGSYGKTSTRNFLVQILSTKYKVVTTPKNINTEIGVARFILGHDFINDDIFVVEMGAYRKGEIKIIAGMVHPEIGIITTIGTEHLALFGSIENIQDTKAELFDVLPKHGLAITNSDNSYCREAIKRTTASVQTFGAVQLQHPTLLMMEVTQEAEGIVGVINILDDNIEMRAPIFGVHNAANLSAAYLAASHIGMETTDIVAAIATLTPTPHRLERRVLEQGVTVLDDTYNSNPEGFVEALKLLAMQEKDNKIVLTRGMLELGSKEKEEHVRIGRMIGETANTLIIISADNAATLAAGATETNPNIHIEHIYNMRKVIERYHDILSAGNAAILLENKVPLTIS